MPGRAAHVHLDRLAEPPVNDYTVALFEAESKAELLRDISAIYGNLPEPDPPSNFADLVLDRLAR